MKQAGSDRDARAVGVRPGAQGGVWGLAALSAAICLCAVLGAKLLTSGFERPQLIRAEPQPRAAKLSKPADIDFTATGSIPQAAAPLAPCGDAVK